jgi:hypothetical protein
MYGFYVHRLPDLALRRQTTPNKSSTRGLRRVGEGGIEGIVCAEDGSRGFGHEGGMALTARRTLAAAVSYRSAPGAVQRTRTRQGMNNP